MLEIWKDIPDYEDIYQASNLGNIRSLDRLVNCHVNSKRLHRGKILKPALKANGYYHVDLCNKFGKKTLTIHSLVLKAFIGLPQSGEISRHGENGSLDNRLCNLSYGTYYQNRMDCIRDGTHNNKIVYCSDGRKFLSIIEASKLTKIDDGSISKCCQDKLNSAGGFNWSYIGIPDKPILPKKQVKRSDGVIFDSIKEAAQKTGCWKGHICNCCKGNRKTTGGFGWSYYGTI